MPLGQVWCGFQIHLRHNCSCAPWPSHHPYFQTVPPSPPPSPALPFMKGLQAFKSRVLMANVHHDRWDLQNL